jgi:hypothetical protein
VYLKVENPGTFDVQSLLVLGVTDSRGSSDKIGQFGSGSIHSCLTFMRNGIYPIICIGNLRVEMSYKEVEIDGKAFRKAVANISGKTEDGRTVKRTEDLSYTLEWGELDWTEISFACREGVSNALDGCMKNTGSHKDVVISVEQSPRAKAGYTRVYIPYTQEVKKFYNNITDWFLHFAPEFSPNQEILPKKEPGPAKIYSKGVFIREVKGSNSVYDYNCKDLVLNESRTSDDWSVRYSVVGILAKHEKELRNILRQSLTHKDLFETTFSQYLWSGYREKLADAYTKEFGDMSVICDNEQAASHIYKKGYSVVSVSPEFNAVLRTVDRLLKDTDILSSTEVKGIQTCEPSPSMIEALEKVWSFYDCLGVTYGKVKPKIQGMVKQVDGGDYLFGQYCPRTSTVFINNDIGGRELVNTMVHEVAHHITGEQDGAVGFVDFAFGALAKLV